MAEVANALMDFSQPMNVELLETTVGVFYGTGTPDQVRNRAYQGWVDSVPTDHHLHLSMCAPWPRCAFARALDSA